MKMSLKRTSMPGGLIPTLHSKWKALMVQPWAAQLKKQNQLSKQHNMPASCIADIPTGAGRHHAAPSSPVHACSDVVEQALSILVFCCQCMFNYQLPLLQCQLLVELYNLHIIRAILPSFRTLQARAECKLVQMRLQRKTQDLHTWTAAEYNHDRHSALCGRLPAEPVWGRWLVWT